MFGLYLRAFSEFSSMGPFFMNSLLFPLLTLFDELLRTKCDVKMAFLKYQNQMLRDRIGTTRIVPTPEERAELLRLGELCGHDVGDLLNVVVHDTYKTWMRKVRNGVRFRRSGRRRIAEAVRALVRRLSLENNSWSYRRVCGELKKLGIFFGDTTVRNIMIEENLGPPTIPNNGKPSIAWGTFIRAHMETLCACDFFTKKVVCWHGTYTVYVLVFIHMGSRKVWHSYPTVHPDTNWVMQQCRNASMWLDDEGLRARFLIRDRDRKYPDAMKEFWKAQGCNTVKTPVRAPRANSFAESYIGTLRRECLNHFICFSADHLHHIQTVWATYYNERRPHRGVDIGNNVLDVNFTPKAKGAVKCREQLGGLIKDYYRDAA